MMVDGHMSIEVLPNDVLLRIFSCHRSLHQKCRYHYTDPRLPLSVTWKWHRLAHVCRRWRYLIFASPHHLGLRLAITHTPSSKPRMPVSDLWPVLPISIWSGVCPWWRLFPKQEDEVVSALKHPDRIHEIKLIMSDSMLEKSATLMEASFPALESLHLSSPHGDLMVLPDAFLGASTPSTTPRRLLHIELDNIYFPTLPHLLLSSRDLTSLSLRSNTVMGSAFLSPEAIISALCAASQLKSLSLYLRDKPKDVPGSIHLLSPNHLHLPALNKFCFNGSRDYLEDFVSRIHAPLLEQLEVFVAWQDVVDFPQLSHFIHRTEQLSSLPHLTFIRLKQRGIQIVHCFRHMPSCQKIVRLQLDIFLDWQVSQVHHVCQQLSPLMSKVEQLVVAANRSLEMLQDKIKPELYLRLLQPFHCVQELELYTLEEEGTKILHALEQSTRQGVQEVLPALHSLWLPNFETRAWSVLNDFISFRQLTGRQVTVHRSGSLPCFEEFRSQISLG